VACDVDKRHGVGKSALAGVDDAGQAFGALPGESISKASLVGVEIGASPKSALGGLRKLAVVGRDRREDFAKICVDRIGIVDDEDASVFSAHSCHHLSRCKRKFDNERCPRPGPSL